MEKSKGLVLLSFVLIIICTALLLLGVTLTSLLNTHQTLPISYTQSDINTIRIIPKTLEKYIYATISSEDTVVLKDIVGEKRAINLEKKNWKDIKWNTDFTLISALGESNEGKFNLFIYNLAVEKWEQITSYSEYSIDQYFWANNDEILFTQGKDSERWLHSYKYSAKGQVIKLKQIQGDLIKTTNNKKILIFKENLNFLLRDSKGDLIVNFTDLKLDLTAKDIVVLYDPSKVVIKDSENKLHIYDLIEETTSDFPILNSEAVLMCAVNQDFSFYTLEDGRLNVQVGDTVSLEATKETISFKTSEESKISIERCTDEDLLIKSEDISIKWFNNNSKFPEIIILEGDSDVDVKIANE